MDDAASTISIHHVRRRADVIAIKLTGDLDLVTAPTFQRQICALLDGSSAVRLELDLSGLAFCDLAGMRAVHAVAEAATKTHHQTWITAVAPCVDLVLQLCQIPVLLGYTAPSETQ